MSVDYHPLKQSILDAFLSERGEPINTTGDVLAEAIAKAVRDYILSLEITYSGGLSAPNGDVSGDFNFTFT